MFFKFYKLDFLHCVNLRLIMCYFDTFICCNMLTLVVIFTTLYKDSTILLSIFITLCTRSLALFCTLVPLNNVYLIPPSSNP